MSTLVIDGAAIRAVSARVTEDTLIVDLADGRSISAPLAWYPRLLHGSPEERRNHRLIGTGEGIHWPELDEDISVEGLIAGSPSGEGRKSFERWLKARSKGGSYTLHKIIRRRSFSRRG